MASPDGFTFFYGDYEHTPGEVYPQSIEMRPVISRNGFRWGSQYRMRVGGNFLSDTTDTELDVAQLTAKISELDLAYRDDYKDCGFKDPDGNVTPHVLYNNDTYNLTGNRVQDRSWVGLHPTEYANTRSFSVTISALFKDTYGNILEFNERVTKTGDAGERFVLHERFSGPPVKVVLVQNTKVTHMQSGTIVGLNTWPDPVVYTPPYWPAEEQTSMRKITQHSPRHHGHNQVDKLTHYRVDYRYFFERPTAESAALNLWVG